MAVCLREASIRQIWFNPLFAALAPECSLFVPVRKVKIYQEIDKNWEQIDSFLSSTQNLKRGLRPLFKVLLIISFKYHLYYKKQTLTPSKDTFFEPMIIGWPWTIDRHYSLLQSLLPSLLYHWIIANGPICILETSSSSPFAMWWQVKTMTKPLLVYMCVLYYVAQWRVFLKFWTLVRFYRLILVLRDMTSKFWL